MIYLLIVIWLAVLIVLIVNGWLLPTVLWIGMPIVYLADKVEKQLSK